jgi:hypothetical protein
LLRIDVAEIASRPRLLSELGFDHLARGEEGAALELAASCEQIAALDASGVRYDVAVVDLEAFYASRLGPAPDAPPRFGAWLSPAFGSGSIGGYYTFAEVASVLDQIHAAYPALTTAKASLGTSVEGRALWMLKISDNPGVDEGEPEVRLDALHHAREPEGMQSTLWFALYLLESYATDPLARYLVDEREIFVVPVVNPDGYVYNQTTNPGGGGMWRKNRRNNGGGVFGVDLNRNYADHWGWDNTGSSPTASSDTYRGPSAASEPEVQAMQAFIQARQFASALSIHTYGALWLYPFGYAQVYPANNAQYAEVSSLATELNHYEVGPPSFILYLANGVTCDYDHDVEGTLSWSPELGSSSDGFWPPTARIVPLAEENLLAEQRTALAAGAWVRVLSRSASEVGDGDGFFEPGESVAITVTARNSGRAASATGVTLDLSTSSPHATVTSGPYSYGSIAGFAQATSGPLSLAISPGAPGGVSIPFTLTLSYEGWSQTETGAIDVGEPVPFLVDDAESDWGWTKGQPGDTATSGLWARGAPIGTSSSGQPASPSLDNTPAPGTRCYLTGNGGGSAGTDDVDNGFTTLLSPVFDLSSCGPATLSFARWFADLTVADDTFAISISNDGGQTWASLADVTGNQNAWTTSSFRVPDFVPQTAGMRLRFVAADQPNNSVVEAAVDDLRVTIFDAAPRLNVYGRATPGATVLANLTGPAGASFVLQVTPVDPTSLPAGGPPYAAILRSRVVASGAIPGSRLAATAIALPAGTQWSGRTLWYRGVVVSGPATQRSNWAAVAIQ